MILFKKLKYKNFMSSGNIPIEIDLDSHSRTIIVGANGHGKSSILEALTFGLFGKSFRGINKPKLINSQNKRELEVEVTFHTKGRTYRIRRGMKPAIFEIYMDDVLINQTASSKDYQKYIEDNVLKLNFNSFRQIVVLGSNNFIPFMRLPAAQRREIIEDLLDISVFGRMNTILKDIAQETKELIQGCDSSIALFQEKIKLSESFLNSIRQQKEDKKKKSKTEIAKMLKHNEQLQEKINKLLSTRDDLQAKVDEVSSLVPVKEKTYRQFLTIEAKRKTAQNTIDFLSNNSVCPTCHQNIDDDFRAEEIKNHNIHLHDDDEQLTELKDKLLKIQKAFEIQESILKKLKKVISDISEAQTDIQFNNKYISKLEMELSEDNIDGSQEEEAIKQIDQSRRSLHAIREERDRLVERRETENIAAMMLKDTGLKTSIIMKYIPYMNELINGYLDAMDFYVNFQLDENFTETIRSQYRDEFSYENFSEGEKQRIDIAILLAWREVARQKNSMATNLLIMDETFDSSMDSGGVDELVKILYSLQNLNVFVISHNESMIDRFDRVLRVEKKNNFSVVKET